MKRADYLRLVYERHEQHPDFEPEVLDRVRGRVHCERYAAVIRDADLDGSGQFAIGFGETLQHALDFLAGFYPEWYPHAVYDLDDGRSVSYSVHIWARESDDPAAALEADLVPKAVSR